MVSFVPHHAHRQWLHVYLTANVTLNYMSVMHKQEKRSLAPQNLNGYYVGIHRIYYLSVGVTGYWYLSIIWSRELQDMVAFVNKLSLYSSCIIALYSTTTFDGYCVHTFHQLSSNSTRSRFVKKTSQNCRILRKVVGYFQWPHSASKMIPWYTDSLIIKENFVIKRNNPLGFSQRLVIRRNYLSHWGLIESHVCW